MKEIVDRLQEPTPVFWNNVQKVGLAFGVIGGALILSPVSLLISIGSYFIMAGSIIAGLSQLTSTKR